MFSCVFVCIHVNRHILPVVTSFEQTWHESYWVRTGMISLARVITWKTCEFTVNICRHIKCVHRIRWIEPVQLVNSLTEHVKLRIIVCWAGSCVGWHELLINISRSRISTMKVLYSYSDIKTNLFLTVASRTGLVEKEVAMWKWSKIMLCSQDKITYGWGRSPFD